MFKRLLYIFLFLLTSVAAFAQQYPVQGSLAIASPYPANLSDYANSNIQNLALNLTLTDLAMVNKRVRLKLFIQTQNATIAQSIDNVSGEPLIMLDGGIPQRFTSTELAHYFRLENLQGINPDGYARSLPEGIYTIGFEVYDYFTGSKLSGRISQTFWMIINDPPLLNSPTDKSKIADFTSISGGAGGIIFNWTPRSTQVTNTEYEFTLSELWDATGDPYQQFMSAIPKYQTTVSNTTTLIYSLTQPPLVSGYTYAWRVRAKAKAGFEDVGLYRNDGYSNLFTFRYGDPCPAPQSLALEAKTFDEISARWEAPLSSGEGSGVKYKLAYRKYSAGGQWNWAETETSDLFLSISNLEPATEYEIKVGVPCNDGNSTAPLSSGRGVGGEVVYTPSQRATTLAAGQIAGIDCGKEPTIDLSKQTLLTLLKAGDVVMANDFPTTITRVTGTSQGWSGEGWTKVPWLGDTRIHVTYASIKVNSDHKLIDGSFITTYDPTGKNIGDIDKTIDDALGLVTGGTDVGKVVTGTAATTYTVPYTITPVDTVGSTFKDNGTGGGTITLASGKTIEVASLPSTVQDAAGTVYQADDKGKLTKVGSNSSNAGAMLAATNLTVVDASKGTVTFAPTSDMKYAFDAWQKAYDGNSNWSKRYETLPISGQSGKYRVSSKLMVPGEADKVLAIINLNDKSLVADSVQFVNAKGTLFERKKITDNSCELSLVGGPAGDAQEVYAIYPSPQGEGAGVRSYTLGKLLVATYEPKTIDLALVPVNDAELDSEAITRELKKVYEPLGINFNLTPKDKFEYEALETASLKVEGSGLLSVYTDQMKALNAAFVAKGEYDKNTIYLFGIDQPESQDGKSIEGVMPRGQQFGYMFVKGKNGDAQGLTATHEIGHGVFQLQHVFDYSGIKQKAITPLNVMDYPAGEALSKLQWDLMHDPGLVISVFETDKGVEITLGTNEYLGFSPNGDVIMGRPNNYSGVFLAENSYFVTGFKTNNLNVGYKWDANSQAYTVKSTSLKFDSFMKEPVTGKVAIWNPNFEGKCFTLYKWINVKDYTKDQFESIKQKIANDDGSGWKTDHVAPSEECKAAAETAVNKLSNRRKLLFVNGYRFGSLSETNNSIEDTDTRGYWNVDGDYGINTRFINALKPGSIYYADGHMDISTSNHSTITNFACSGQNNIDMTLNPNDWKEFLINISPQLIVALSSSNSSSSPELLSKLLTCEYTGLNTSPNKSGFERRRNEGRIAGGNLLTKMKMDKAIFKNKYGVNADTLDIVCHSMGYAYALGMIDVLKDSVTFGRFYIIAPENAGSGGTDWNMFTEVWQYGSDEQTLKGTPKLQDGVAPQVPVQGIEKLPLAKTQGGRAYIPIDGSVPQGFLKSHSIGNYKWIFTKLLNPQTDPGYVKPRL